MALATRNLYLVLKARDEASRVVRGFGRELSRAGKLAQAENLRNAASLASQRATQLQSTGASAAEIDAQKRLAQQLTAQAQALERSHRQAVRFANALQTVSSTVVTVGSGLAIGGAAGLAFLISSVNVARDYELQVRKTATQVDGFSASLEDLSKIGLDVAKNVAVPFEDIQPALYNILSSTNANLEQATILLNSFARTAVAGQVSIEDAAKGTIPILNAFNIPLEDVNRILDIQFQLVRKGVGDYGQFATVFGRVVPSATRAGQTFEEVAAGLAYLTRNGLTAATASTSFARALDAISNPVAVKNMEEMGISVRDVSGNMLPLEQILSGLREKLNALPNADRVAALVEVFKGAGGTIQARRFLDQVLLRPGELEEFIGYLDDMKNSSGSFESAYETMAQSVAAQSELLRNKWKVVQETIGRIVMPIFLQFIVVLQKVLDWFNGLSPKMQRFITLGILIGSVFAVVAGIVLVFIGVLAGIAAAIVTAGSGFFVLIGAMAGVVALLGLIGAAFYEAWTKSDQFRGIVSDVAETLRKFYNDVVKPFADEIKAAFEEKILPAAQALKAKIEEDVLPVLRELWAHFSEELLPKLKELANFIKTEVVTAFDWIKKIIVEDVIPALQIAKGYYEQHKETIDKIIDVLVWLGVWLLKIAAIIMGVLLVAFGGPILAVILAFVAGIAMTIVFITWLIEVIQNVVRWFGDMGDHIQWLKDRMADAGNAIKNFFLTTLPGVIKDAAASFGDLLVNAGKELINGLIRGIESKLGLGPGSIGAAMTGVTAFVRGFLPGSPAKWGPLSGSGAMYYAGQAVVKQLSAGIDSMQGALAGPSAGMALGPTSTLLSAPGSGSGGASVNQSIVVNTQEISPVRQSSELGFLLAGRM
jgi:TP901 family phage tail tape measure protein